MKLSSVVSNVFMELSPKPQFACQRSVHRILPFGGLSPTRRIQVGDRVSQMGVSSRGRFYLAGEVPKRIGTPIFAKYDLASHATDLFYFLGFILKAIDCVG
jgi:hypothetical protein